MSSGPKKIIRCAIYTRKSTEHGLELEFNSLDAQRESCEAYVRSQAGIGWQAVSRRYDDPAFSGGSLDRPALQQLETDIDAGLIDVIVVYKIDRLTRSLADFAKLVELFDAKSVSFVAVTQQFNTTTSMGRLTLNVLLSFAQFERELSSERVRDKVAASRKKGKWTGGNVPFGYRVENKKLIVEQRATKIIRSIFSRYLELKSLQDLLEDLNRNKNQTEKNKKNFEIENKSFTYGALAYLLKNRIYIGEIGHKGDWHTGEHQPIVDRSIFDAVQKQIVNNSVERRNNRIKNSALLTGRLFDDRGNRMSPSYTIKRGVRYRFYVNSAILTGKRSQAGVVRRISALNLENIVVENLRRRFGEESESKNSEKSVQEYVRAIVLHADKIEIKLLRKDTNGDDRFEIRRENNKRATQPKIEYQQPDRFKSKLVESIVRANSWLNLLLEEKYNSIDELAEAQRLHPKTIRQELRLAFLAPDLIATVFSFDQPSNEKFRKLQKTLPLLWSEQMYLYGQEFY